MTSANDELAERRFRKLVDHLRTLMSACVKPEYRGYYGQLLLHTEDVADLGDLAQVRRAARAAGRELGWHVRTHASEGHLFILDTREAPGDVQRLAGRRAAEAIDRALFDGH